MRNEALQTIEDRNHAIADELLDNAQRAAQQFRSYSVAQVERIVSAVADAAEETAEFYAEWAVRETGKGRVSDKIIKNLIPAHQFRTENVADYVRYKVDAEKKMVCFPKPAGVVMTLIPVTNPVTTVTFKALTSLITRNAVILSPHPGARECSTHAAECLTNAAENAGAPNNAIQVVRDPSVSLVNVLMGDERTNVILATGGPAMVRAAYSSSNPALGVGPGNVPVYVDRTANVRKAAERIVKSLGFDNGIPCTSESVAIADAPIADQLIEEMNRAGAYIVVKPAECEKLRRYMYPDGKFNADVVGKDASWIAAQAGFGVPELTRVLSVPIDSIGAHEPFSKEKLCPVMGFIRVNGGEEGTQIALAMLELMGAGHSAVIHANNPELVAYYGARLPVCRISVNAGAVTGGSGIDTNLYSSAVIGTGFFGRSSVDVNVGPAQLLQWTRVAYNKDPAEVFGDMENAAARVQKQLDLAAQSPNRALNVVANTSNVSTSREELASLIREALADELRALLRKNQ